MKWLSVVIVVLFVIGMVMGAGCPQAVPSGKVPVAAAPSPCDLALTAADAPANYTLVESRAKTSDEVGSLAKDLGWQGGYVVKYSGLPDHPMGATEITQMVTTYPAAGMAEIVAFVDSNDRADPELIITTLPSPGLGENSIAFSGQANSQIILRPDTDSPFESGSLKGSFKQNMVEIVFSKGSTLEVFKMTGPYADYATLMQLAETAYAKLP